jgi:hypothetical protein
MANEAKCPRCGRDTEECRYDTYIAGTKVNRCRIMELEEQVARLQKLADVEHVRYGKTEALEAKVSILEPIALASRNVQEWITIGLGEVEGTNSFAALRSAIEKWEAAERSDK